MGFYIQVPERLYKRDQIVRHYNGIETEMPETFEGIGEGRALIAVVENGEFEAACFVHDAAKFEEIKNDTTGRPILFCYIDLELAKTLSGYISDEEPAEEAAPEEEPTDTEEPIEETEETP